MFVMRKPYRKINPKFVAFIVILGLILVLSIVVIVMDTIKKPLPILPIAITYLVLVLIMIVILSMLRYDFMRNIRGTFKETNLPLYTDQTTLMCHDIKDEAEESRKKSAE